MVPFINKPLFRDEMVTLFKHSIFDFPTDESVTLDKINNFIPIAFCPICLLFMCPKHLSSKAELNIWTFDRIR